MKKAKIILTAITLFALAGGALAFKTARFNEFQLWTVTGVTTTSTTTGGFVYTATIPACKTVNFFATDDSPVYITNARLTIAASIKGTVVNGTATTLIPFSACPVLAAGTFITLIP